MSMIGVSISLSPLALLSARCPPSPVHTCQRQCVNDPRSACLQSLALVAAEQTLSAARRWKRSWPVQESACDRALSKGYSMQGISAQDMVPCGLDLWISPCEHPLATHLNILLNHASELLNLVSGVIEHGRALGQLREFGQL